VDGNRATRARRALACLLVLGTVLGCGGGIDAGLARRGEFEPYFQRFLGYARDRGMRFPGAEVLRIEFRDLRSTEVGRCESGFLQGRIVYIDRNRWKSMSDSSREALMLHELGHCLLGRGHRGERFDEDEATMPGLPKSLMFPYATAGTRYLEHQEYYLDELFAAEHRRRALSGHDDASDAARRHEPHEGCQAH
jgi:hypothetical protein